MRTSSTSPFLFLALLCLILPSVLALPTTRFSSSYTRRARMAKLQAIQRRAPNAPLLATRDDDGDDGQAQVARSFLTEPILVERDLPSIGSESEPDGPAAYAAGVAALQDTVPSLAARAPILARAASTVTLSASTRTALPDVDEVHVVRTILIAAAKPTSKTVTVTHLSTKSQTRRYTTTRSGHKLTPTKTIRATNTVRSIKVEAATPAKSKTVTLTSTKSQTARYTTTRSGHKLTPTKTIRSTRTATVVEALPSTVRVTSTSTRIRRYTTTRSHKTYTPTKTIRSTATATVVESADDDDDCDD